MNIDLQDINRINLARIDFLHQNYNVLSNQFTSFLVQNIEASLPLVWSIVRRFNHPQTYKKFIKNSIMVDGDGGPRSIRHVTFVSGLPASFSLEKLDWLDDDLHAMKYSIIGGDHRLANYESVTTLHEEIDQNGGRKTVVTESYVVDVPVGNTKEETCCFLETIVGCNLRSLASVCEKLATY